jgi:hypothetical protein
LLLIINYRAIRNTITNYGVLLYDVYCTLGSVLLKVVQLGRSVCCEVVGTSELFITGGGPGAPSCLTPDATEVSKTWSGMTSGLSGCIPYDLKPLVPVSAVTDLDRVAVKIS